MKKVFYILGTVLVIASCEKVIDVPLNEADIQNIVEGKLYDVPGKSYVSLSRSGSVYNDSGFEKISGAQVVVTDDLNNSWTFAEVTGEAGMYVDTSFVAQPNRTYDLTIINGTDTYTATSTTSSDVSFDSLDYTINVGGFGQQSSDTNYFTFFNFTDNGNEENYYRAIPYINGARSGTYYLTDDKLFNGYNYRQPFYGEQISSGDTLVAELQSMDEAVYTFFYTLANNQNGGPFSPTPANPVTNIEGNAIGFFGAFMTDYDTIYYP